MNDFASSFTQRQAAPRPDDLLDDNELAPGIPHIWFFVFFEAFLFTSYFTVYVFERTRDVEAFLQSQSQLSLTFGIVNTLILLISSWSMARCVHTARQGRIGAAMNNALLTLGFGILFMISKIFEWAFEIEKGFYFTTDEFFSFYYFLTGIHFLHLLIGFVFLGVVVFQLRQPAGHSQAVVETSGIYWHMVDFLWVMIFALLYVMR